MRELVNTHNTPFYTEFSTTLIKAEENGSKWNIYLEASNQCEDQQSEILFCKALQDQKDYYLKHGVLSWNHLHKTTGSPKWILGEPEEVAFSVDNKTLIKGMLYKENEEAQNLMKNILSGAKALGASVGGGILKKSSIDGKTHITSVIWDETALTHCPVNDNTLGKVSILPFAEFCKSLMAGSGVDAGSFTGGRSLATESLQGGPNVTNKYREAFNDIFLRIVNNPQTTYSTIQDYLKNKDFSDYEVECAMKVLAHRIPQMNAILGKR